MGLVFASSLLAFVFVWIWVGWAVTASTKRARSMPLYWIVAVVSVLALTPLVFMEARPHNSGGEYAGLATLIEAAFSWSNAGCLVGAVVCLGLAHVRYDLLRSLSGASWGLLAAAIARMFALF